MKKLLAMLLALVMVLSMVACGAKEEAAPEEKEEAATEEKKEETKEEAKEEAKEETKEEAEEAPAKDSLVFQINVEPANLDLQTNGTMLVGYLVDQIYGKLMAFDENSELVCELAESYEWNDDFTQLTFKIRPDAKFSDGSDITAADFIYTYSTDAAKANTYLSAIDSMEAPDDKTLVMNLKQSNSSMLKYLTTYHTGVLPEGSMEATDINKGATAYSGPYALESWEMGAGITFVANENWYGASDVAIKKVEFKFIGDENSSMTSLEAGEIDFMYGTGNLSPSANDNLALIDGTATVQGKQAVAGMLCLNFTMPELDDVNVRRAISAAIDRESILKVQCLGETLGNVFTYDYFGEDWVEGHGAPAQDLEKAKEYLAASNYPDGFQVEMKCTPAYIKSAAIVQSNLAEIGIDVLITEIDSSVSVKTLSAGDYQMSFMTFSNLINDITGFINLFDPEQALHFNFDDDTTPLELLQKAATVGGEERTAVVTEFADWCEENVPYVGVFSRIPTWAHTSDLYVPTANTSGFDLAAMHW